MRQRKIVSTVCVVSANPHSSDRYKPGSREYRSITEAEKFQFQIEMKSASVNQKKTVRLDNSWEKLCRKISDSRASERLF